MTELITSHERSLVRPVAQPQELIAYHEEITKLIQGALKLGIDYGVIPGAGDKPTLLKAGAERLCLAFGASASYGVVASTIDHDREVKYQKKKKVWNNKFKGDRTFSWEVEEGVAIGLYRYVISCEIKRQDGRILGNGQGVCSTLESKYVDRPRDLENTVLKMAQKRALVGACLNAFGLSNRFTQDVEDLHDEQPIEVKNPAPAKATDIYNETPTQKLHFSKVAGQLGITDTQKLIAMSKECKGLEIQALEAAIKEILSRDASGQ